MALRSAELKQEAERLKAQASDPGTQIYEFGDFQMQARELMVQAGKMDSLAARQDGTDVQLANGMLRNAFAVVKDFQHANPAWSLKMESRARSGP